MNTIKESRFYGFEDYRIVVLSEGHLFGTYGARLPWSISGVSCTYLANKNLPVEVKKGDNNRAEFSSAIYTDHPELLDTAKKVYVHPACSISRTMMAEKYGKCLNPWLADAVVVPALKDDNNISIYNTAIFSNDDVKLIVVVRLYEPGYVDQVKSFSLGSKFKDLCMALPVAYDRLYDYTLEEVLESELFFAGECLMIYNNQSYILDALTRSLPVSKTVFEETVQKSLSSEDNKITFEVLTNIRDMLSSPDESTIGTGLKALSMMDYMHYPNSIRYIIRSLEDWSYRYCKAANSTSVKFMFKQLSQNRNRNRWPGNYDYDIYEQDYALFKQLVEHYDHGHEEDIMMFMSFMTTDGLGTLVPRLKTQE